MDKLLEYDSSDDEDLNEELQRGECDFFSLKPSSNLSIPENLNMNKTCDNNKQNIKTTSKEVIINNCKSKISEKVESLKSIQEWNFGANQIPLYSFNNYNNALNFSHNTNYTIENNNSSNMNPDNNSKISDSSTKKYISKRKVLDSPNETDTNQNIKIQKKESKLILEQEYSFMRNNPHKHPSHKLPRKLLRSFKCHDRAVGRLKWCSAQYGHLLLSTSFDSTIKVKLFK